MSGEQEYQVPVQFVMDEMHARLQAKETDLIAANARIRHLTEEIRVLQEASVRLQEELEKARNWPEAA